MLFSSFKYKYILNAFSAIINGVQISDQQLLYLEFNVVMILVIGLGITAWKILQSKQED